MTGNVCWTPESPRKETARIERTAITDETEWKEELLPMANDEALDAEVEVAAAEAVVADAAVPEAVEVEVASVISTGNLATTRRKPAIFNKILFL